MSEKPKREAKNRFSNWQKTVISLALLLGIMFASCFLIGRWLGPIYPNTIARYEGEAAKTRIAYYVEAVPESAEDVYLWLDAWIDTRSKIRFTLPAYDAELWLEKNNWRCDEFTNVEQINNSPSYNDPDWWIFENIKQGLEGRCYGNSSWYRYWVTIDQTQDNFWTFYIDMTSTN